MFTKLEQAEAAAARIAEETSMDPGDGNHVERGIEMDLARRLCAVGTGYSDWSDLERRVGTSAAPNALWPQEVFARIAAVGDCAGLLSHPLQVEGLLHPAEAIASSPTAWIDDTIALTRLVSTEITRLEVAESVFDYVRLASDPEVDDVELTALISLSLGMEIDLDALRAFREELADHNARANMRDLHDTLIPNGDDDFLKMAICSRAGRIDEVVRDMDGEALAPILAATARHIAAAGGAVASRAMLMRLAVLRPYRGTWRDEIRDQLPPRGDA